MKRKTIIIVVSIVAALLGAIAYVFRKTLVGAFTGSASSMAGASSLDASSSGGSWFNGASSSLIPTSTTSGLAPITEAPAPTKPPPVVPYEVVEKKFLPGAIQRRKTIDAGIPVNPLTKFIKPSSELTPVLKQTPAPGPTTPSTPAQVPKGTTTIVPSPVSKILDFKPTGVVSKPLLPTKLQIPTPKR